MLEEFVRFVLCRFPIVARDGDIQIVWQRVASKRVNLLQSVLRNERGVRALALGQGNRYGWVLCIRRASSSSFGVGEQDVPVRFRWAV